MRAGSNWNLIPIGPAFIYNVRHEKETIFQIPYLAPDGSCSVRVQRLLNDLREQ
jgi:hypothetical protein